VVFFLPADVDLRVVLFLRVVVFFAAVFFFAADFFFAPDFFFEAALRDDELLDPERELELERDEERVRAAMAGTFSARSSLLNPSISSIDGSPHEPALDVGDVSPVPLQSSWVIDDLLVRIARARFPTTYVCNVQRGQTSSSARC
jgi:hypothetical protein